MEIELCGHPWDERAETTVRTALAPLAAMGVRDVYVLRFASAPTGTWRAWANLEDGRDCSVKSNRGPCETPFDELPQLLEQIHLAVLVLVAAA